MSDILQIPPINKLFEDIVVSGLRDHASKEDIRLALIDVMRKEVFGQMVWRMKVEDPTKALRTPKNEEIVKNIAIQTRKRWASLMKECNKWKETAGLIKEDDLQEIWADEKEVDEDDEDGGYKFCEAEDPEEGPGKEVEIKDFDGWTYETTMKEEPEEEVDEMTAEWPELNDETPVTSGYVQVEEDDNAELSEDSSETVEDEALQGELAEGSGEPSAVLAEPAGSSDEDILLKPGEMIPVGTRFPAGYWIPVKKA